MTIPMATIADVDAALECYGAFDVGSLRIGTRTMETAEIE